MRRNDLDPEMFEVIVSALLAVSQLANVHVAWKAYRLQERHHLQEFERSQFRRLATALRRDFAIVFESVDEIMQIFAEALQRDPTKITGHEMRFGKSGMILTNPEYNAYSSNMAELQGRMSSIRAHCSGLIQNLAVMRVQGEHAIGDSLDDANDRLNNILFETDSVEEAASKLRKLEPMVSDFLERITQLGN
jgi:hypothetical protein